MQGPRLYRFFNYELPEYLPAPTAGWNPDVQPWECPLSQAPQLDNFLIHPGKLVMRGPVTVTADLSTWYPLNVCGVGMTSTGALIGRKSTTGGQVDPWNAPLMQPAASDLASGLTTGLWVVGGTVSTQTLTADQIPGPRWINFDGLLYGISYDSASAAVGDANSTYSIKPLSLCTLQKSAPGGQPSASAATYVNNSTAGSLPWSIGSPSTASTSLQSQTRSATTSANGWGSGPEWTGTPGFPVYDTFNDNGGGGYVLVTSGFGFSIPSNAVLQGVAVSVTMYCDASSVWHNWDGVGLYDGVTLGNSEGNGAVVPTSATPTLFGGSTDLWGAALTPATLNDSGFGIYQWVTGKAAVNQFAHFEVTGVSVTAYYYVPAATEYLEATGFGFSLPNTAIVQGIAVTITRRVTAGFANDNSMLLVKGGILQSTNRSSNVSLSGTMTSQTFGGATDLWGASWAYSDINASNFGAVYQAITDGGVAVQSITIQVWWTSGSPITATPITAAPHGGFDLIGYQSRIWMLGGIDTPASGTTHDPLALFFTNPIAAGGGTASADWKDPVAGTTNKIVMDGDASDYGVGLATVRNGLVVLRRASVYLLKGSTTANYALVPVSRDVGCLDARSIIEADQGVYFISAEGLMLTNGTSVVNVSGSILHTLRSAIQAEQKAVITGKGGYITCGRTSHGHIIVSIGIGGTTAGTTAPIFSAIFDPVAAKGGAWVRLTSQVWTNDGQQAGGPYPGQIYDYKAPKRLLTIGDRYITALQDQSVGLSMTDYNAGLYDALPSGANPYVAIPAAWHTVAPAISSAAKRVVGQLKRYYIDYQFAAANLTPSTGWVLQPVDAAGNSLDAALNGAVGASPALSGFVAGVTPAAGSFIARAQRDSWVEVGDFLFVVTWSDIARAQQAGSSLAEIYGCGLEFQHTRERGHGGVG